MNDETTATRSLARDMARQRPELIEEALRTVERRLREDTAPIREFLQANNAPREVVWAWKRAVYGSAIHAQVILAIQTEAELDGEEALTELVAQAQALDMGYDPANPSGLMRPMGCGVPGWVPTNAPATDPADTLVGELALIDDEDESQP